MDTLLFNQEWYGARAAVRAQSAERVVVDYGCEGRGVVTSYALFAGVQLCFLDFDTDELFPAQTFSPDIIEITHCRSGRYECEFADHTVAYLPAGCFGVAATEQLPVSFSFPLRSYTGVSLVVDRQAVDEETRRLLQTIPIDLEQLGTALQIDRRWYVRALTPELAQIFPALYAGDGAAPMGYLRIKALEILYHIAQLEPQRDEAQRYFDKRQIQATKAIRDELVRHLDEKLPLAALAEKAGLGLSTFYQVFSHIYGETPYVYLKNYKMNLAAQWLAENNRRISDIALELGYSNASKFSSAFRSVYGVLPKDYRKSK